MGGLKRGCFAHMQNPEQYEFELTQLWIEEQIAQFKPVGRQIIYYWANSANGVNSDVKSLPQ